MRHLPITIASLLCSALWIVALPAKAATGTFTINGTARTPPVTVTPPTTELRPRDTASFINQGGGSITVTLMDSAGGYVGNNCIFSSPSATCDLALPIAGPYSGCVGSSAGLCDLAKFAFDVGPVVPALPQAFPGVLALALGLLGGGSVVGQWSRSKRAS